MPNFTVGNNVSPGKPVKITVTTKNGERWCGSNAKIYARQKVCLKTYLRLTIIE